MPADPKRLQVINRIVDVLQSIREGDDYFYSPRQVGKGFIREPQGFPIYSVTSESGGDIAMHGDSQYAESFYVAIRGIVEEIGSGDMVTPIERAIRDVKKAVEADMASGGGAETLIGLATEVTFDIPAEIDYGLDSVPFKGYFILRIRIRVDGTFSEI